MLHWFTIGAFVGEGAVVAVTAVAVTVVAVTAVLGRVVVVRDELLERCMCSWAEREQY